MTATGTGPGVRSLTWPEVSARRLERHGLATPDPERTAADVVSVMCGAHAQILSAAEISVSLRLPGSTRVDVRRALWTERSLVKTFGPRGTVHLLATRDLPLWTGALAAMPQQGGAQAELLSPEQADDVVAAIATALAEAELTVDELTEAIVRLVGVWAGEPVMEAFGTKWPRWRAVTSEAANRGALCFGPNRGQKVTYTNPHRWLAGFKPMPGPAAHAELVRRFLHAYGPATPQDFARWLNAPRRCAGDLFAAQAGSLEPMLVDGREMWVNAGDTEPPDLAPSGLRLLPYFDAYAVGGHPRDLLYPGRAGARALAGGQAGNYPVLLIDGTVAGVWHLRRAGRRLTITVETLSPLTNAQLVQLDEQVERIGVILEGKPELTIGTVSVGPHA